MDIQKFTPSLQACWTKSTVLCTIRRVQNDLLNDLPGNKSGKAYLWREWTAGGCGSGSPEDDQCVILLFTPAGVTIPDKIKQYAKGQSPRAQRTKEHRARKKQKV